MREICRAREVLQNELQLLDSYYYHYYSKSRVKWQVEINRMDQVLHQR